MLMSPGGPWVSLLKSIAGVAASVPVPQIGQMMPLAGLSVATIPEDRLVVQLPFQTLQFDFAQPVDPAGHKTSDTTVKHSGGVLLRACYSEAKAWRIRNVLYNLKEWSATSTIVFQRSV
jgi:hypothetical protein